MFHPDDALLLIIGFSAGSVFGSWVGWTLAPRRAAEAAVEAHRHDPFERGAVTFANEARPLARGLPVGIEAKPQPYSVGKDERVLMPLLALLLNEYSGGDTIPRTGVPLTWVRCSKWGMKRAGWKALCEYVFPGRGYLAPGPGGKLVTILAAARAREFVRKARKAGKVGAPLLNEDVFPEI